MGSRRRRGLLAASAGAVAIAVTVGVSLTEFTTAAAAPLGDVRVPGGGRAIDDQYIVVFKPSLSAVSTIDGVRQTAEAVADAQGADVARTYSSVLRGFTTKMSEAKARRLAADPRVAYVQQDGRVRLFEEQDNATWGLDRIDQRDLPTDEKYTFTTTAAGVNVYVIDTGIRTTHQEFGGRAKVGVDTVGDGQNGQDCQGHGTHVAGTIGGSTHGVAKEANLFAVRVLDCQGSGSDSAVIAGIDWVTRNAARPAVVNMSLGGGASPALDEAVRRSVAAGITYVVAAGNENQDACDVSPARVPEAITVGATTRTDARASFSNFGSCVDVFAPGEDITSTWNTGDTATNTISGTSMASPHTAGVAALFLSGATSAPPEEVATTLTRDATPDKVTGLDDGSPNKLLFSLVGGGEG